MSLSGADARDDREHSVYDRIGSKERDEHGQRDTGDDERREAQKDCKDPAQCERPQFRVSTVVIS
jgi:hypothetical protein